MRADDALKYAAAMLKSQTGWAGDSISGSMCDRDHEDETDAIYAAVDELRVLAARFGDPNRYSDGRVVQSSTEIQFGLTTSHIWQPELSDELSHSWRGNLPSDPGVPSPGAYEVTTTPATQEIHVRVMRTA